MRHHIECTDSLPAASTPTRRRQYLPQIHHHPVLSQAFHEISIILKVDAVLLDSWDDQVAKTPSEFQVVVSIADLESFDRQ